MERQKLILLILDGWGCREDDGKNAVTAAHPANFNRIWHEHPHMLLDASEEAVGLPAGQMGNSEVGHTNLGAGRVVFQDFLRINNAVKSGDILKNDNINDFFTTVTERSGRLHFFGLLSDGGVHSHILHLKGLVKAAKDAGVKEIYVHCFMDGRDTPPKSGKGFISDLDDYLKSNDLGRIASVIGRYWAMDRDRRWDRVQEAYEAIRNGAGIPAKDPVSAVEAAYGRGETDEFIKPTIIESVDGMVEDGDSVFFFNFRADRARELSHVFVDDSFSAFPRGKKPDVAYLTLTDYGEEFPNMPVAFPPQSLNNIFGKVVSEAGLRQLRIAETEKYAHVTFFFNGGEEKEFPGERRILVPSPRDVATYDEKPSMSVGEVVDRFEDAFRKGDIDVVVMNFANPDMVGHSGIMEAATEACEAVDAALGRVLDIAEDMGAAVLVTADHGNSEQMWDFDTDQPHTAHTTNPVPFVMVGGRGELVGGRGKLADVAPTMLKLLGLPIPADMDGDVLVRF